MRPIKYRFWDTFNGLMVYDRGNLSNFFKLYQASLDGGNNPKLMQYVDRKDENGVPIYEKDIIQWGNLPKSLEIMEYKLRTERQTHGHGDFGNYSFMGFQTEYYQGKIEKGEVIGNIYQHGHLLEKPSK